MPTLALAVAPSAIRSCFHHFINHCTQQLLHPRVAGATAKNNGVQLFCGDGTGVSRVHGNPRGPAPGQNNLPLFLEPGDNFSYHTTKVAHNCLLADRFAKDERPVAADLALCASALA